MYRNKRLAGIIVIAVCMLLAACSPVEEVFSVSLALSGNPSTLDPHATTETLTFQVSRSIYDTLLEPDEQGNLRPALASSWEVSADSLAVTFELRTDAAFHDGSRFDAHDVAASIERLQSADFASPSAREFAVIEELVLIDDFTIRFNLSEPSAPLLYTLASGWAAILPSEAIESGHNFADDPIGTGPFTFSNWVPDEHISLNRNDGYWTAGVELEEVLFRIIPEPSIQVQSIISEQVNILYIINDEDLPILEAANDVTVEILDSSLVLVMAINTSREPLSNLTMRQALSQAIDKQTALDVAYGGGTVVGSFNDVGNPFYEDFSGLYPYDPDRARELAAEAGYSPDRVFDLVLPQNFAPHVQAGELYQEMFRKVGIQAQIRLVDWPTWISDVFGNANYDLTVIGHTGKLDPDGRFIGFGTGTTYVRWANEELASLIEEGRQVIDIPARREVYRRVQRIFAEGLPFVFVGTPTRRIAHSTDIEGFIMTPNLDTFDFRQVRRPRGN